MSRLLFIYDWDDTLVRTQPWVKQAYLEAGLGSQDIKNNWGKPWQDWVTPEQHDAKNYIFKSYSDQVELTSLGKWIAKIRDPLIPLSILTGASSQAIQALKNIRLNYLAPLDLMGVSHSSEQKARTLRHNIKNRYYGKYDWFIYIDDDINRGIKAIHNTGAMLLLYCSITNTLTLFNEEGNEVSWILSSLQQELTLVFQGSLLRITNHFSL